MCEAIICFFEDYFGLISKILMAVTIVAIMAHYILVGPKHPELAKGRRNIHRLGKWEIVVHAVTMISFIVLGVTGFIAVFKGMKLTGLLRLLHVIFAPFFAIGLAAMSLAWAETCRFQECDWQWVKKAGGYLWKEDYVPADKYNAGQKAFFWAILILGIICMVSGLLMITPIFGQLFQRICYLVHRYSSLILVLFVFAHFYLGTLANPGTWQVILSGYVTYPWAKHHHPIWWEKLDKSWKSK